MATLGCFLLKWRYSVDRDLKEDEHFEHDMENDGILRVLGDEQRKIDTKNSKGEGTPSEQ